MENVFHIRTTRCHRCQCGMKNLTDADASKEDVTRCPWASAVSPSASESSCTRVNKMRTRITSRRRTKSSTALLPLWLLKLANCTDLALNTNHPIGLNLDTLVPQRGGPHICAMNTEQLTLQTPGEMPFRRKLCLLGYIPDANLFAPPHSREQIRLDSKTYHEDQKPTGKSSLVLLPGRLHQHI